MICISTLTLVGLCIWAYSERKDRTNPYKDEGLVIEWRTGGATSSYPWIEVWTEYEGARIVPEISFGGIESPRLRFRDYDSDGRRDIIFEDDRYTQAVAFYPAYDGRPPKFVVLGNDVTWP